jgi:uncharacterized membrane protein YkgB
MLNIKKNYMKLEIEDKIELPEINSLEMEEIDFSSIKELVGNKPLLEHMFQETKNELIYG